MEYSHCEPIANRELSEAWRFNRDGAAKIADAPRFQYRGMHLDVARNFHDKASVKKLVELMSFYKLNRLHLHLTDDEGWRLEIKQLPELTEVGGLEATRLMKRSV